MAGYGIIYVVVGLQYGDEGKGKIAATLPLIYDIFCGGRGGVGPNAGHVVTLNNGKSVEFRTIPEVAVHDSVKKLMIGPGTLVDPEILEKEIREIEAAGVKDIMGRLLIDHNCGIVEPRHRAMEGGYLQNEIGSMVSGCGAKSIERIGRDLSKWIWAKDLDLIKDNVGDVPGSLYEMLSGGKNVVASGTQGFGLSLYHGSYPFTTSKDTTASQVLADLGIGPGWEVVVVGCLKPYTTRAGTGPMPGLSKDVEHVHETEIRPGVVIGSDRRVGSFDIELVKEAAKANSIINGNGSYLVLTNVDRLWPENYKARSIDELSLEARRFIDYVESSTNAPVGIVSVGPSLDDFVLNRPLLVRYGREANR